MNLENCPASAPFYNGKDCMNCENGKYFDFEGKDCIEC